jgi:hypothetical protein
LQKEIYGSYTLECADGRESSVFIRLEKVKKKHWKSGKKILKLEKKLKKVRCIPNTTL